METQSIPFSSSGLDVIISPLHLKPEISGVPNPQSREELVIVGELYEVEWTASEIIKGGFKQVALQFPDELLYISVPIYQLLKRRLSSLEIGLYVLADTSYGSCCADEVAAQHIDADVIVHYGYSCLSLPSRLPVIYVFSKAKLDVHHASDSLLKEGLRHCQQKDRKMKFILICDVAYAHVADDLLAAMKSSATLPPDTSILFNPIPKLAKPTVSVPAGISPLPEVLHSNPPASLGERQNTHRRYTLPNSEPVSDYTIFYLGPESLALTNLLMTHPGNTIISYDPTSSNPETREESSRTNKLLGRRYGKSLQARDADVFGILVGTLGVASYLPLLSHLRELIRRHHKKSYTLSVGKLTPAKLANFAEIECFVMVACPENSVIDSKDFYQPIVTPFELALALNAEPTWPGNYILDFERVMEDPTLTQATGDGSEKEEDSDRPTFSLITGKYRHAKRYGEEVSTSTPEASSSLTLRNADNALARTTDSAGADFLHQRTFKGLEQRLGEDGPSILEQGRSGIARGYTDDHPQESKGT